MVGCGRHCRGKFHGGTGHDDCECLGSEHCGCAGRNDQPGNLGDYLLCSGRGNYSAPDRLDGCARRPGAYVSLGDEFVRCVFDFLWVVDLTRNARGGARVAGLRRRSTHAFVADLVVAYFSKREGGDGDYALVDDNLTCPH